MSKSRRPFSCSLSPSRTPDLKICQPMDYDLSQLNKKLSSSSTASAFQQPTTNQSETHPGVGVWRSKRSKSLQTSAKKARDGEFCQVPEGMDTYLTCRKDVKLQTCLVDDQMVNPCWDRPRVVIVGAGVAGLAAAQRLLSCGITDVTVLEATDRPGGRIHSCWMGDKIVDLGADFIEGASVSNGAYALAVVEGLFDLPSVREEEAKGLSITSEGDVVCPFVTMAATNTFKGIVQRTRKLFSSCVTSEQCGSLYSYIGKEIERSVVQYPCKYRAYAARVMVGRLLELKSKIGGNLDDVSACQFGSKKELTGGNLRVPTGMVGILAPFLRTMPDCYTVRYCKPVKKIFWCDSLERPRAEIFCTDGELLCADYVILTPSLGVLKQQAGELFEPCLPEKKLDAIENMGFGTINQLYLEYNTPFWVWNEGNVLLGWNNDEIANNNGCWLTGVGAIKEWPFSQQIMQLTVAGSHACYLESASDVSLAEDVTRLYRSILKTPSIPYPVNVLRSKWAGSSYFRGSRSYYSLKTTVETQKELAKPVPQFCGTEVPVLLFAGEHTALGEYGTIQGAKASGVREAERVLELTRQFQGRPRQPEPCGLKTEQHGMKQKA